MRTHRFARTFCLAQGLYEEVEGLRQLLIDRGVATSTAQKVADAQKQVWGWRRVPLVRWCGMCFCVLGQGDWVTLRGRSDGGLKVCVAGWF